MVRRANAVTCENSMITAAHSVELLASYVLHTDYSAPLIRCLTHLMQRIKQPRIMVRKLHTSRGLTPHLKQLRYKTHQQRRLGAPRAEAKTAASGGEVCRCQSALVLTREGSIDLHWQHSAGLIA